MGSGCKGAAAISVVLLAARTSCIHGKWVTATKASLLDESISALKAACLPASEHKIAQLSVSSPSSSVLAFFSDKVPVERPVSADPERYAASTDRRRHSCWTIGVQLVSRGSAAELPSASLPQSAAAPSPGDGVTSKLPPARRSSSSQLGAGRTSNHSRSHGRAASLQHLVLMPLALPFFGEFSLRMRSCTRRARGSLLELRHLSTPPRATELGLQDESPPSS